MGLPDCELRLAGGGWVVRLRSLGVCSVVVGTVIAVGRIEHDQHDQPDEPEESGESEDPEESKEPVIPVVLVRAGP